jgi:hypothetical protein
LGLLERYRGKYQVLEVDPQLLRYMRPSGKGTVDPDESDVLEDRLLLEAIHGAWRSTRTRANMRVVTADVLFARMLRTEGIPSLVLAVPPFPDNPVECIRFDAVAKTFVGAPLQYLLWDLSHTFSAVKLRDSKGKDRVSLEAYWPLKTPTDWEGERLKITRESDDVPAHPPKPVSFSTALIPEASFPLILRVAGVILEAPIAGADELLERMPAHKPTTDRIARMALEILLRAGFVQQEGQTLRPSDTLAALSEFIQSQALDDASRLWMSFPPYAALTTLLQGSAGIQASELPSILTGPLGGAPAKEACDRLARFPVYLGQAWTDGDLLRDGSARPAEEVAANEWRDIFEQTQQDGFCSIADLLPAFCKKLNQSPWASARQIRKLSEEGRFADLSFQPAAGKRPVTRDEVVGGSLVDVSTIPVPIDRIDIGGRPTFSVVRGSS